MRNPKGCPASGGRSTSFMSPPMLLAAVKLPIVSDRQASMRGNCNMARASGPSRHGRDVHDQLVRQAQLHEAARQRRAGFDQHVVALPPAQFTATPAADRRGPPHPAAFATTSPPAASRARASAEAKRGSLVKIRVSPSSCNRRDVAGVLRFESSTTRNGCLPRVSTPGSRTFNCGSSLSTVSMPVSTALACGAQMLHVRTRRFAGDPAALAVGQRHAAIETRGDFDDDSRQSRRHALLESRRSAHALRFQQSAGDLDAGQRAADACPAPCTCGLGSSAAHITRFTPARISASVHGGVRL